jgi:hypothetical protein
VAKRGIGGKEEISRNPSPTPIKGNDTYSIGYQSA